MNPYSQQAVQNKLQSSDGGDLKQRQIATGSFSFGDGGYSDPYENIRKQQLIDQNTMSQNEINSAISGMFNVPSPKQAAPINYNFPQLELPSWLMEDPTKDFPPAPQPAPQAPPPKESGGSGGWGGSGSYIPPVTPPKETGGSGGWGGSGSYIPPVTPPIVPYLGDRQGTNQQSTTSDGQGNYTTTSSNQQGTGYFSNSALQRDPNGYIKEGGLSTRSPYSGWKQPEQNPDQNYNANPLNY